MKVIGIYSITSVNQLTSEVHDFYIFYYIQTCNIYKIISWIRIY